MADNQDVAVTLADELERAARNCSGHEPSLSVLLRAADRAVAALRQPTTEPADAGGAPNEAGDFLARIFGANLPADIDWQLLRRAGRAAADVLGPALKPTEPAPEVEKLVKEALSIATIGTQGEIALQIATNAVRVALASREAELTRLQADNARLKAEMERRDRNENRNCINWGPCSRHDGRMDGGSDAE